MLAALFFRCPVALQADPAYLDRVAERVRYWPDLIPDKENEALCRPVITLGADAPSADFFGAEEDADYVRRHTVIFRSELKIKLMAGQIITDIFSWATFAASVRDAAGLDPAADLIPCVKLSPSHPIHF